MYTRTIGFGLAATFIAATALLLTPAKVQAQSGADLHIHNKTGTSVEVYIFEDDTVHKDRKGGLHSGDLKDGETGTAHVKACKFSIVLFHEKDAYHAEFHDCKLTDITITGSNK